MKLNKPIILIFCLLFLASITYASERASISATATVIPSLGVMPTIDNYQSLSITKATDSQLLIQAPKNSALLIHIERAGESVTYPKVTSLNRLKYSVSDIYVVEISPKKTPQIVTIITTDN